jgi:UbiD family decarboxylase
LFPTVDITCVTQRADAIYQAVLPGFAPEHCLLGAVAIETVVSRALQRLIPSVRRVFVTDGGMGRLHAIVTMHRPQLGEGKRAVLLATLVDAGRLGEYLDILKRSVGRLSEHGHAG